MCSCCPRMLPRRGQLLGYVQAAPTPARSFIARCPGLSSGGATPQQRQRIETSRPIRRPERVQGGEHQGTLAMAKLGSDPTARPTSGSSTGRQLVESRQHGRGFTSLGTSWIRRAQRHDAIAAQTVCDESGSWGRRSRRFRCRTTPRRLQRQDEVLSQNLIMSRSPSSPLTPSLGDHGHRAEQCQQLSRQSLASHSVARTRANRSELHAPARSIRARSSARLHRHVDRLRREHSTQSVDYVVNAAAPIPLHADSALPQGQPVRRSSLADRIALRRVSIPLRCSGRQLRRKGRRVRAHGQAGDRQDDQAPAPGLGPLCDRRHHREG